MSEKSHAAAGHRPRSARRGTSFRRRAGGLRSSNPHMTDPGSVICGYEVGQLVLIECHRCLNRDRRETLWVELWSRAQSVGGDYAPESIELFSSAVRSG